MTAPDSRDSVERVLNDMHAHDDSPEMCAFYDRLQALARGPQQAGGEDAKARNEAAALDSALNAVQELQAEVARLRESLSGSRNVLDLLRSVVSAEGVSKFTHVESRSGSLVCVQSTINAIDAALNGGQDDNA